MKCRCRSQISNNTILPVYKFRLLCAASSFFDARIKMRSQPPIAVAGLLWREDGLKHWEVNWPPRWDSVKTAVISVACCDLGLRESSTSAYNNAWTLLLTCTQFIKTFRSLPSWRERYRKSVNLSRSYTFAAINYGKHPKIHYLLLHNFMLMSFSTNIFALSDLLPPTWI